MTIFGTTGNDALVQGTAGNDTIDGLAGADTMVGLTGDDYYILDNMGDVVIEGVGEGTDTIYFTGSFTPYTLADNVENFILDAGVTFLDFNDNALDNTIDGGGLNNFFIFGGGGGNDTISNAGFVFAGTGNDTINGFSNSSQLHGEAGDDIINGGDAGEQITGGAGNDTAYGGAGNDFMWASTNSSLELEDGGNDAFFGGTGNDTIYGGLDPTHPLLDPLAFDGNDTLEGGAGNDSLFGGTGDDILNGGTGADTMSSSDGSDVFYYDNIGDVITNDGTGIDTIHSNVTTNLVTSTFLGFSDGFENLILTGSDDIDGTGTIGNNTILGNSGTNTLVGGAGDDLYGVDNTTDVVTELLSEGTDTVNATATFTLSDNIENLNLLGTGDINGTGNGLDNNIRGNSGANVLNGGLGNDSLLGNAGDDTVDGGAGIDAVSGGSGDDVVNGGADNDSLFGNEGDDILDGGMGNDSLNGSSGNDTLNGGDGSDTAVFTVSSTSITVDIQSGALVIGSAQGTDTVGMDVEFLAFSNGTLSFADTAALVGQNTGSSTPAIVRGTTSQQLHDFELDYGDILSSTVRDNASFSLTSLSSTRMLFEDTNLGYAIEFTGPGIGQSSSLTELDAAIRTGLSTGAFTNATLSGPLGADQGNGDILALDVGNDIGGGSASTGYTLTSGRQTFEVDGALPTSVEQFEDLGRAFADLPDIETLDNTQRTALINQLTTLGVNEIRMQSGTGTTFGYDISEDIAVSVSYAGEDGNDDLSGGAGDDSINGMAGDDIINGLAGNDTLIGEAGNDVIDGGGGNDIAVFGFDFSDASILQNVGVYSITANGETDIVSNVENFQFTDGTRTADQLGVTSGLTLTGTTGVDVLTGAEGNDLISGLAGNDRLIGNAGNDTLNGGDGVDTLNGGDGDDFIFGGDTSADLRDIVYAGAGNDTIDSGYGNDLVFAQDGDDNIAGGFGSDTLNGQNGNDVITGSALSDLVSGNAGDDFVNGGFGHDRINGGTGADRFFHLGIFDHGSDWVQDYSSGEGDLLLFGNGSATGSDFQINYAHTATDAGERSGDDNVQEAFVIYRPTGQIMWALVDGEGQTEINLRVGGVEFDLLA